MNGDRGGPGIKPNGVQNGVVRGIAHERGQRSVTRSGWCVVILFLLLAPRVGRALWPSVWIEDDNYLYSAYLISRGEMPYRDFVQANPPLLEQAAAPFFRWFGPSHRVGEFLSSLAMFAGSLAIWFLGSRFFGWNAGALAALFWAWLPLGFRYHLFEREVFSCAAALVGMAFLVAGRKREFNLASSWAATVLAGLLFGIAFQFKQGGLFPCLASIAYLCGLREWRRALVLSVSSAFSILGLLAVAYGQFGPELILQSFLLHFIKGSPVPLASRLPRLFWEVGPLLPMTLWGLWVFRRRPAVLFPLFWLGFELIFSLGLSSTFWPHYMIPLQAPMVLLAGGVAAEAANRRLAWIAAVLGLVVLGVQVWKAPLYRMGLSGIRRAELRRLGSVVAELVPRGSRALICPPLIALEADRIKSFSYIDTLGFTRQLRWAHQQGRLLEWVFKTPRGSFAQTLGIANATWLPEAVDAVRKRRVRVVVPEPELPIGVRALRRMGFLPVARAGPYAVFFAVSRDSGEGRRRASGGGRTDADARGIQPGEK